MIILVILQLIVILVDILFFTQGNKKAVGTCSILMGILSIGMAMLGEEKGWVMFHSALGTLNIAIGLYLIIRDET